MQVVVSREPTVYINHHRELIVSYTTETLLKHTLSDLISKAEGFEEVTRNILSNLFEKLTKLSISFHPAGFKIEQDAEIDSWKYVVVKIKLDVREEIFDEICNLLLSYAYKDVKPEDAIKVLLVFEHV